MPGCALRWRRSTGRGLTQLFGSPRAEQPGSHNLAGIKIPAVDALIDTCIQAEDRDDASSPPQGARPRAARRPLTGSRSGTRASTGSPIWDMFAQPATKPRLTPSRSRRPGGSTPRRRRESAGPAEAHGRLHPPPHPADDPDILGIMAISFLVVQFAPGGPVERVIAQIQGTDVSATARISGGGGDFGGGQRRQAGGDAALQLKVSRRAGARLRNSSPSSRSSSASTSRRSSASS